MNAGAELGPRLVVVVRPAIYEGAYAAALVRAPIAPLLYVYAAVDDGDSLRLLRADEAGSLAASHAEVLAAGIRNLEERGARLLGPEQSNEGREVLLVESGDGLESSRLVVPGWLAALTQGKEPAVAAAPTWTTLFVAPRPDEAALADLMDLAEEAWAGSGHPALAPSSTPPALKASSCPLALPAEHPLSARLASLHARFAAAEYERQREVLELGLQGHERSRPPWPMERSPNSERADLTGGERGFCCTLGADAAPDRRRAQTRSGGAAAPALVRHRTRPRRARGLQEGRGSATRHRGRDRDAARPPPEDPRGSRVLVEPRTAPAPRPRRARGATRGAVGVDHLLNALAQEIRGPAAVELLSRSASGRARCGPTWRP
jgi:hypothetical protein